MKRYIRDTIENYTDLPLLEEISIYIDADVTKYIESADLIDQGVLDDTQVVAEWQTFVGTVEGMILNDEHLVLLGKDTGKGLGIDESVPGSYYFYIGVRNADGEYVGKVVVDFRLSTHDTMNPATRLTHEQDYLKVIQKTYPSATTMIQKDLKVNTKEFTDYDIAKMAVVGMLSKISKVYGE